MQKHLQRCRHQNELAQKRRLPLRQSRPLRQGQEGEGRQQVQVRIGFRIHASLLYLQVYSFSPRTPFLSTTEFTILSRTLNLQGWVSDVPGFFVHDGIK